MPVETHSDARLCQPKNGALSLASFSAPLIFFFMLHTIVKGMARRPLSTAAAAAIEQGKKAAAYKAVDDVINSTLSVVGIGSGSTIRYAVDRLKDRRDLKHIVYVPTSFQSRHLIQDANLKLGTLEQFVSVIS